MSNERVDSLIAYLGDAVDEVGLARVQLAHQSAIDLGRPRPSPATFSWITDVQFQWHYQIARQEKKVVLLFFTRAEPEQIVLDARLDFDLRPVPLPPAGELPRLSRMDGLLRLPAIIEPPGSLPPGQIRFNLGGSSGGTLEIANAESGLKEVSIVLHRGDQIIPARRVDEEPKSPPRRRGPRGHRPPSPVRSRRRWSMTPFLAFLESLQAWRNAPERGARWVPFELPSMAEENPTVARRAIAVLVEGYLQAVTRAEHPTGGPDSVGPIAWSQAISKFAGTTRLRLSREGLDLAARDEENPLVLDLRHRIIRRGDRARFELELNPPDFLVQGELHGKLVEAFREGALVARLFGDYSVGGATVTLDEPTLNDLFSQGAPTALVLRTGRERTRGNKNLLVLKGTAHGVELVMMFFATFKVDAATGRVGNPSRLARGGRPGRPLRSHVLSTGGVQLLRPVRADDDTKDSLREDTVKALLELMITLHRWGGLLP